MFLDIVIHCIDVNHQKSVFSVLPQEALTLFENVRRLVQASTPHACRKCHFCFFSVHLYLLPVTQVLSEEEEEMMERRKAAADAARSKNKEFFKGGIQAEQEKRVAESPKANRKMKFQVRRTALDVPMKVHTRSLIVQ